MAGLFMIRADARHWGDADYRQKLYDQVDAGVGGVAVFLGGVDETAAMVADLQSRRNGELLIAADYEHGLPMRLDGGVAFPRAMALGRTLPAITEHVAGCIADEARAIGVHWNFAPVADVNSNPLNPIINTRSFGDDPQVVARHVEAYVRGTQQHGVLACIKHAPGHGDTNVDSHVQLPTITADAQLAATREYVPFTAGIAAGVRTLMLGHIRVPFLDSERPASLSAMVVQGLVRGTWGFTGLVTTDALDMHAITSDYSSGFAAVYALQAGVDVLLMPESFSDALEAVVAAYASGEIPEKGMRESLERWRQAREFHRGAPSLPPAIDLNVHAMMALQAAYGALEVRGDASTLPLLEKHVAAFAVVADNDGANEAETTFMHYLANATEDNCDYAFINDEISDDDVRDLAAGIEEATVLVFAFFQRAVAFGRGVRTVERMRQVIGMIKAGRPVVVVACGSPYGMDDLGADTVLHAYSDTMPSIAASVMRLVGRVPAGS